MTAFNATRALTATCATSGSSSAVRATIAGAASTLPSRPRPTTAWSRTRGLASARPSTNGPAGMLRRVLLAVGQGVQGELAHRRVAGELHERFDRLAARAVARA